MVGLSARTIGLLMSLVGLLIAPASANDARLTVGAGAFDFYNGTDTAAGVAVEVRGPVSPPSWSSETFLGFAPAIGVIANSDEGGLVYAMVTLPFVFGHGDYEFDLSAGVGAYEQGNSNLDLGGTAQFILGMSGSRALANGHRIGVTARHASNADLQETNRGVNTLMVTWTIPFLQSR